MPYVEQKDSAKAAVFYYFRCQPDHPVTNQQPNANLRWKLHGQNIIAATQVTKTILEPHQKKTAPE